MTAIVKSLPPRPHKDVIKVFDLGCGSGNFWWRSRKKGIMSLVLIHPSHQLSSQNSISVRSANQSAFDASTYLIIMPPTKFDVVVMDNVIEHLLPDGTPTFFPSAIRCSRTKVTWS